MEHRDTPTSVTTKGDRAESEVGKSTEKSQTLEALEHVQRDGGQDDSAAHRAKRDCDIRKYPVLRTMIQQREQEIQTHELAERAIALRQRMERQRRQEGRASRKDST